MAKRGKSAWNKGKKLSKSHKLALSKSHKGKIVSAETKKKLSKALKGRVMPKAEREKHSKPLLGIKRSAETKKKLRLINLGKKLSVSTRQKISQSNLGRKHSDETKKKLSKAHKGKKMSETAKRNMSLAQKGKPLHPNSLNALLRNAQKKKGTKLPKKTKEKLRLANLGAKNPQFGKPAWNKGKTGIFSEKTLKKMSLAKSLYYKRNPKAKEKLKLFRKGQPTWNKGKTGIYSEETLEKIRDARRHQVFPAKDSKPERFLQQLLRDLKIKFVKHKPILGQPDIFIEPNFCIFVDGDYWHANPRFYGKNQLVSFPGKKIRAKTKWKKDADITKRLKNDGYKIMRFWEFDIFNYPEKCIEKILKKIQKR